MKFHENPSSGSRVVPQKCMLSIKQNTRYSCQILVKLELYIQISTPPRGLGIYIRLFNKEVVKT